MGRTNNILYLVFSIFWKLLFSMRYEDYRTDISKHAYVHTQIECEAKCNFLLLPSNQERSKQQG